LCFLVYLVVFVVLCFVLGGLVCFDRLFNVGFVCFVLFFFFSGCVLCFCWLFLRVFFFGCRTSPLKNSLSLPMTDFKAVHVYLFFPHPPLSFALSLSHELERFPVLGPDSFLPVPPPPLLEKRMEEIDYVRVLGCSPLFDFSCLRLLRLPAPPGSS